MFILTDGKYYVMEHPMKQGFYLQTTSPVKAKEFNYKQARKILNSKHKSMSWINSFYMVNQNNGEIDTGTYKGNGGVYIGDKDIDFDDNIFHIIYQETETIMGLSGWNLEQLKQYEDILEAGLSKYDSAESDINHALQKYKENHNGKKPQAHKMAKIAYLSDEIRDKHKHIKQCLRYISVMKSSIMYGYPIEKLKIELEKAKNEEYKGRTEYFKTALEILE